MLIGTPDTDNTWLAYRAPGEYNKIIITYFSEKILTI